MNFLSKYFIYRGASANHLHKAFDFSSPLSRRLSLGFHDDVIKWEHFPRYWPFARGIHRSPLNSPQKGQWFRALMFSLFYAWTNALINNRDACGLRRHRAHYYVTVMNDNWHEITMSWQLPAPPLLFTKQLSLFAVLMSPTSCLEGNFSVSSHDTAIVNRKDPVTMVVLVTGHQVGCLLWVQVAISNKEIGLLCGLKFLALNIRILTTKSMFDVANMLKH